MWAGLFIIALYMVNVRVVARLLVLEMRGLSLDDHALCIMPFIDLKRFLHF